MTDKTLSDTLILIAEWLIKIAFSIGLLIVILGFLSSLWGRWEDAIFGLQMVGIYIAAYALVAAPVLALFRISQHVRTIK